MEKTSLYKPKLNLFFIGLIVLYSLILVSSVSADITTGLKFYYPFNEGVGSIANEKINNFNAPITNPFNWVLSQDGFNSALNISIGGNVVGDYVGITGNTNVTTSCWINLNNNTGSSIYMYDSFGTNTGGNYWDDGVWNANNELGHFDGGSNWHTNYFITNNKWYMVTYVYNTTTVQLYVNGTYFNKTIGTYNYNFGNANPLNFGKDIGNSYKYNGVLSNCRIYNRVLTASDILELFNNDASTIKVYPTQTNNTQILTNIPNTFGATINSTCLIQSVNLTVAWSNGTVYSNYTNYGIPSQLNLFYSETLTPTSSGMLYYNFNATDTCSKTYQTSNIYLNASNYTINLITYNPSTISGSYETFTLNVSTNSPINSAYLVYNNIPYLTSMLSNGNNNYILSKSLNIPYNNVNTNYSFYFLINTAPYSFNTNIYNQTTSNISIDNCSTYTNLIYNFTTWDQENLTRLNTTLNLNINIAPFGSNAPFLNFSKSYDSTTSNKKICLSIPLNNSIYSVYIVADYQGVGFVKQFYYVDNGTLTNTTSPNINLYDLLLTSSTTFLATFSDSAGNPVPNAIIHVYRYYIGEGLYREVENGKLDSQSQTHLHLTEEDVIYYFTVTLNNQLLYTSPSYNAVCISSPCTITLSASTPFTPFPVTWSVFNGTSFAFAVNKTNRIAYLYFTSNNVHLITANLYTIVDGNKQLINTTSLTATAGTLSLFVPYPYGNQTFYLDALQDNVLVNEYPIDLQLSGKDLFGAFGVFLIFLLVASLILITSTEGVLVIVFAIVGVIVSVLLYLMDMLWVVIISIIIAGGLIIWKISSRKR